MMLTQPMADSTTHFLEKTATRYWRLAEAAERAGQPGLAHELAQIAIAHDQDVAKRRARSNAAS